jgi:hypothetical protein
MPIAFEKLVVDPNSIDFADRICKLTDGFPRGCFFLLDRHNRAAKGDGAAKGQRRSILLIKLIARPAYCCTLGIDFLIFDIVCTFTRSAHGPSIVRRLSEVKAATSSDRLVTRTSSPRNTRLFDHRSPIGAPSESIPPKSPSCAITRPCLGSKTRISLD